MKCVVVDYVGKWLTKYAYFLVMRETDEIGVMVRRYVKEVESKHGVPVSTILLEITVFTSGTSKRFSCLWVYGWIRVPFFTRRQMVRVRRLSRRLEICYEFVC